jgi:hypothetical protein
MRTRSRHSNHDPSLAKPGCTVVSATCFTVNLAFMTQVVSGTYLPYFSPGPLAFYDSFCCSDAK